MRFPYKTLEKKLFCEGYDYVLGIDEVGMGCLAGPVIVCAVRFNKDFFSRDHKKLSRLRDSKLLSSRKREEFVSELVSLWNLEYEIASCSPKTIDKLNIYQAARRAMRRATKALNKNNKVKSIVLVDGRGEIPDINQDQQAIIKGDRKVFSIACASIIAKVYRDNLMTNYAKKYPQYGFEKHKGYGTAEHQKALQRFGPSPIHRRSFKLK